MDKLEEACVMLGSDRPFALAPLLEVVSSVMGKPYKFHVEGNSDYENVITTIANRTYRKIDCTPLEELFYDTYSGDITFTYDQESAILLQSAVKKVRKDYKSIPMINKQLYLCYCFPFCVKWMHRIFATYNCIKVSFTGEKMTKVEIKKLIDTFYTPVNKTLDDITAKLRGKRKELKVKYLDIFEYGRAIIYLDRIGALNVMRNVIRSKFIRLPQSTRDKLAKMKKEYSILFETSLYIYKPEYFSGEDLMYLQYKTDMMGRPYAIRRKATWLVRCLLE